MINNTLFGLPQRSCPYLASCLKLEANSWEVQSAARVFAIGLSYLSHENTPIPCLNTGWLIGFLTMGYHNAH